MEEFLERLVGHVHWLVFLLLELFCGVLLFRFNHYQHSVWFTQANIVAGKVLEWEEDVVAYLHLGELNAELTGRNIALQQENEALRQALRQMPQGESAVQGLSLTDSLRSIPARVVANSVRRDENFLTINRGVRDGVRPEMGVLSGLGVVGIVCKVSPHYAQVMSVLNRQSSISCRLRGTEYFGYLKWNGGSPLAAFIDDIPRHARFHVGDTVETSGFSSVFPPGIFVGRVSKIRNSADGLAFQLEVKLSTDLSNVRDVCVVVRREHEELDSMIVK